MPPSEATPTRARPSGAATAASDGAGSTPAPALGKAFRRDGALHHPAAATCLLPDLNRLFTKVAGPGTRLYGLPGLAELLGYCSPIGAIAAQHLGTAALPVRAILFDKNPEASWSLGWHQDRTIAVREHRDVPGFGPWTIKAGLQHVEPPFEIIERLITLRVHLDDVPADNAPLLVASGSHRLGRIEQPAIAAIVARCGILTCLAERGDVWAYATPILHASAAASGHAHRRVLQVDYATTELPAGLNWLGV